MRLLKRYILAALMLLPLQLSAQSVESVKSDPSYLYVSVTTTDNAASVERAISKLLAEHYWSSYGSPDRTLLYGEPIATVEQAARTVETFAASLNELFGSATRRNETIRFIKVADAERIFDRRKAKIDELVSSIERVESNGNLSEALRYCYWAELLLSTLPDPDQMLFTNRYGRKVQLSKWLPAKLQFMLDGLSAAFEEERTDRNFCELSFTYRSKRVTSVDYYCIVEGRRSKLYSAKDGRGVVEADKSIDYGDIEIEYKFDYDDNSNTGREIGAIKEALGSKYRAAKSNEKGRTAKSIKSTATTPAITKAADTNKIETDKVETNITPTAPTTDRRREVPAVRGIQIRLKVKDVLSKAAERTDEPIVKDILGTVDNADYYAEAVKRIGRAIDQKDYSSVEELFTTEGYDLFTRLINYGNARLLTTDTLSIYSLGEEVFCRSLPMNFSFKSSSRSFVEDVVFTFDADRKVSNLSFALDRKAADRIIGQELWSDEARIILITFLENYKTAYALKRLDYIKSIFDDDALIITGRVVHRLDSSLSGRDNKYVILTRQNKQEYMRNLSTCFASNEFINIRFAQNEVLKMGKGSNLFGIQIKQSYFSTNYADEGYLFLMVDLNNPACPVIHVRTWQEEPDPEFGVIGAFDF